MKFENQNKPWTQEEDQVLINVFAKRKYDKTTAITCCSILGRNSTSICARLSVLRRKGLIENSKYSERRLKAVQTIQAKHSGKPIVKEAIEQPVVQQIVAQEKNELLNLALLITSKLNKQDKLELVKNMLA